MLGDHPVTRFALLRHAKTEWNQDKRIQGQNNSPLTPEGEHQAKEWGQLLKAQRWDRIITSDADRTLETASLVNISLKVPVMHDSRLREQAWGRWTGKTVAQLRKENPRLLTEQENAGWKFCPPGGEDRNMVWERSQKALKAATEKWPGETLLVITHQGVIACLINRLCGRQFLPTEPPLVNPYHLHWITHDERGFRVEGINTQALP
jgi:probable phosphoglycerate mutase